MELADIIKLMADYALAAAFLVLYAREAQLHRKTLEDIAEQRRVENAEMRDLLFRLARLGAKQGLAPEDSSTRIPVNPSAASKVAANP